MDKMKKSISIDGESKPIEVRESLWDSFGDAILKDRLQRFTNKSEAMRHFIINFIKEVSEQEGE